MGNAQNKGKPVEVTKEEEQDNFGLGERYHLDQILGRGGTGVTYKCYDRHSKEYVAVKLIKRPIPRVVVPMIHHEIKIQGNLGEGHVNIITAHEVILTHSHLGIVMEYAAGGALTNYVTDRWHTRQQRNGLYLDEYEACYFFRQFISAVQYCHVHHVAHRDLKLDNTLLDGSDPPFIKIADFGFAKDWGDAEANFYTQIGTPVYMSPQQTHSGVSRRGYSGQAADVWASAVLLFVMLLGMFPFEHTETADPSTNMPQLEVWLAQMQGSWRSNKRVASEAFRLSPEVTDLLDKAFQLDEKKRITLTEIQEHPWFTQKLPDKYQQALVTLEKAQAKIQAQLASMEAPSNAELSEFTTKLQNLVQSSTKVGTPGSPPLCINLRRFQTGIQPEEVELEPIMEDIAGRASSGMLAKDSA